MNKYYFIFFFFWSRHAGRNRSNQCIALASRARVGKILHLLSELKLDASSCKISWNKFHLSQRLVDSSEFTHQHNNLLSSNTDALHFVMLAVFWMQTIVKSSVKLQCVAECNHRSTSFLFRLFGADNNMSKDGSI